MSTKETAYRLFDRLTDEQLEGFILMFRGFVDDSDQPNEETAAAMEEADRIARDLSVKGFTDIDEMFREILDE